MQNVHGRLPFQNCKKDTFKEEEKKERREEKEPEKSQSLLNQMKTPLRIPSLLMEG